MNNPIRIISGIVAVGVVAAWRDWDTSFHIAIGAVATALVGSLLFFWLKARLVEGDAGEVEAEGACESPFRAAFIGLAYGSLHCILLGATFAMAGRIDPLNELFHDRNRAQFEARLSDILAVGDHENAIAAIEERLQGRLSSNWRTNLLLTLAEHYLKVSRKTTNHMTKTNLIHQAIAIADTNQFNLMMAETELKQVTETQRFRDQITSLESSKNWSDLISMLRLSIDREPRSEWRMNYDDLLYRAYLAWSQQLTNHVAQEHKIQDALVVARQFHLDPTVAQGLLVGVQKQMCVDEEIRTAASKVLAEAESRIDEVRRANEAQVADALAEQRRLREVNERQLEAAAVMKSQLLTKAQHDLLLAEHASTYKGQLSVVDALKSTDLQTLKQKKNLLLAAQEFAISNHLELGPVTTRLAKIDRDLAAEHLRLAEADRPVDLAPGCSLEIVRASYDERPYVFLDISVKNGNGEALEDLRPKDFQIMCDGHSLQSKQVATVANQPPPLYVVVAIDCSGSMSGRLIRYTIEGASEMISSLGSERPVFVQVITFRTEVKTLIPWTSDLLMTTNTLAGLQTGGRTALYAAVEHASNDLMDRPGDRRLILFTDGKDSFVSKEYDAKPLISKLRDHRIQVHCIGLSGEDLDGKNINALATQTGGLYYEASDPTEISSRFLAARKQLRQPLYRMVLTPAIAPRSNPFPVQITLGQANALNRIVEVDNSH